MSDALLLKPAQVAELLAISRSQVYLLAQSGDLPGVVRLGGSVRVHRPTLEAALAEEAAMKREPAPGHAPSPP